MGHGPLFRLEAHLGLDYESLRSTRGHWSWVVPTLVELSVILDKYSDNKRDGRTLKSFFQVGKVRICICRQKDKKCNSWNSPKLFAQTLIVWCNVLFTLLIKLIPKKRKNERKTACVCEWKRETVFVCVREREKGEREMPKANAFFLHVCLWALN